MNINELLVDFESLIDLDLAIYRFIKFKYGNSELVDKSIINEKDEKNIIRKLIYRKHKNPLEVIMPNYNTEKLYNEIINNHYKELLSYATAYDTFGLMVTFLNNSTSTGITVLCKSEIEQDFIKKLNPILDTIIVKNKKELSLDKYTILYVKCIWDLIKYKKIDGKHIYISNAKYNMDEDEDILHELSYLFVATNIIHLIDFYTDVKFIQQRKDDIDEDLF